MIEARAKEIHAKDEENKLVTIYQSAIGQLKERLKKREEYAKTVQETLLKKSNDKEAEEEGDEEQKSTLVKTSEPAPDQRQIYAQKEKEEFEPWLGLTKDDDWTEFKKKSKFWDPAKKRRFEFARLKHQTKEFEASTLAEVKAKLRSQSSKQLKKPEWTDDMLVLRPKPEPTIKSKVKGQEGIYEGKELKALEEWKKEEAAFLKMKRHREEIQKRTAEEQKKKLKRIEEQPEREKKLYESLKKMKSEYEPV